MLNYITQGFLLIDVEVVALNNTGIDASEKNENVNATKRIYKNGRSYVYVSGQAWRSWWRNTLLKVFEWNMSPISRDGKIVYTDANPIQYPDDDVFGYMRATSVINGAHGTKNKAKTTVTRSSPLKNSALISVASVVPSENFSSHSRQTGDPVPYRKQEYSAIMKGMFNLDLSMIGTFSDYNKTGFKNISEWLKQEALEAGAQEIPDPYVKTEKGSVQKLLRLDNKIRIKRATETLKALKYISGGAMQTSNLTDVTPKLIVLATTNTGNHPFSHFVTSGGIYNEVPSLNLQGIKEIFEDYRETFVGTVFIGYRTGFMEDEVNELKALCNSFDFVVLTTVNKAIDQYCDQLVSQMSE